MNSENPWRQVRNSDQMVGMLRDFMWEKVFAEMWTLEMKDSRNMEKLYWIMEDIKHVTDEVDQFRLRNASNQLPE